MPPASEAPAPQALPPTLARVWETFARREIGRGRRDISNLVEVTLQFLLEHESKSLAPMVATVETIHAWAQALVHELAQVRRLAGLHPAALPTPHPLVRISMVREGDRPPTLVRQPAGEPATTRAQLLAFAQSLDKQLALVRQAEEEHTQALQVRRQNLAETLRSHAGLMHASATEMLAAQPPLPPAAEAGAAADAPPAAGVDTLPAALALPRRGLRGLWSRGERLRHIDWQALSPATVVRACAEALLRGYRAPPPDAKGAPPPATPPAAPRAPRR